MRPLLTLFLPHLGPEQVTMVHGIIRKAAHVTEYFILGLLLFRALRVSSSEVWRWQWSLLAVVGVALWALGDEFHQSFVPIRTASMTDVAIDTAGGILAQLVTALWYRYIPTRYVC